MLGWLRDEVLRAYLRSPEHPAKYRVVRFLGRHVFPDRGIQARADGDFILYLHPRDWIEYLLLRGDRYEPLTLEFICSNLHAGDVAVFAGVNFGQQVVAAARAVGAKGMVLGIEPQPAALLRTSENLRLNGLEDRVRLVSVGLGDHEDLVSMAWSAPENAGTASYLDNGGGFVSAVLPVSQVVPRLCPARPRLMRLHVQGYELNVLKGFVREWLPEILIVAIERHYLDLAGVDPNDVFSALSRFGYRLSTVTGDAVKEAHDDLPEYNVVGTLANAVVAMSREEELQRPKKREQVTPLMLHQ